MPRGGYGREGGGRMMTQVNERTNRDPGRPTIGEPIVEAVGLTKIFSDFWKRAKARAVDGVDFEINRHEIFGLLGPNGSGKSTTIKMILGLLHKSSGRLSVFEREPSDVAIKGRDRLSPGGVLPVPVPRRP